MERKYFVRFISTFLVRIALGITLILFFNSYLRGRGIDIAVGINLVSVGTSGILGVPGVALLYGILFYQNF